MNLDPDREWFPDAGLPLRNHAKAGGITKTSPPEAGIWLASAIF